MTVKIIDCFSVEVWIRGDRHNHKCYVSSKEEASLLVGKHDYIHKVQFVIYDTAQEYKDVTDGKLKEQALSKLTPEERLALGFN